MSPLANNGIKVQKYVSSFALPRQQMHHPPLHPDGGHAHHLLLLPIVPDARSLRPPPNLAVHPPLLAAHYWFQIMTNLFHFYFTFRHRMSYQLYRNTTLGHTLQEALDELMQMQMLSPALALRVLLQFDRSINSALNTRVKNKLNFKAEKLNTYRFCDNVWTFMLNDVEFREVTELGKVDRVKIVACDAKSSTLTQQRYEDN